MLVNFQCSNHIEKKKSEDHTVFLFCAPSPLCIRLKINTYTQHWFVSIVLALVVASWFGCFSSPILVVLLYISFCMYPFPKRHMMDIHVVSSSSFVRRLQIVVKSDYWIPPDFLTRSSTNLSLTTSTPHVFPSSLK